MFREVTAERQLRAKTKVLLEGSPASTFEMAFIFL